MCSPVRRLRSAFDFMIVFSDASQVYINLSFIQRPIITGNHVISVSAKLHAERRKLLPVLR